MGILPEVESGENVFQMWACFSGVGMFFRGGNVFQRWVCFPRVDSGGHVFQGEHVFQE